jgi:muconolactone delta-isomerase
MAQYLVELYATRHGRAAAESSAERARTATQELARQGKAVRYLRAIFVPGEETCFLLFEAASAEEVGEAARRAELPCQHVEAIDPVEGDGACP